MASEVLFDTSGLFALMDEQKRPHFVARFLDYLERSAALVSVNPDEMLLAAAKEFIRRQAEQGYSFVDCLSFCLMKEREITDALTTDELSEGWLLNLVGGLIASLIWVKKPIVWEGV
jgi:predicted nucleic acid-binding protein